MTADELRRRHSEAAREIEQVAQAGHEDLVETAKYERPEMTAEQVARVMVRRDRRIRDRAGRELE